jgi:hypothetical protein
MHIPGYFGEKGLPHYAHFVLVGTMDMILGKNWKAINKNLEEADKMCKYKEYPFGEPEKRFKCDNCGVWRGKMETVPAFKKKHKGHSIKLYWMPDEVKKRLEIG